MYAAAQGKQFITGACTSDAACASGCCAFKTGKCAAPLVAQERGEGCGFGNAQPNNNASEAQRAANGLGNGNGNNNAGKNAGAGNGAGNGQNNNSGTMQAASSSGSNSNSTTPAPGTGTGTGKGAGTGQAKGKQFITGPCTSDADCASSCCGFKSGKCAGPVVAQERDGGCGFGNAAPNDNAAKALVGRSLGRRGPVLM